MTDALVGTDEIWNHNRQYEDVLLRAVPDGCHAALDLGCGQGFLLPGLAKVAAEVVAIDRHVSSLEEARVRAAGLENVRFVEGDAMTHDFGQRFDAVLSIAVLHHLGVEAGLERMKDLTAPGGVLGVIGLARSSSPRDYARDGLGAVETRIRRLRRKETIVTAPIHDPEETYRVVRAVAQDVLPGARYRRHNLFRYSLVWTRPPG